MGGSLKGVLDQDGTLPEDSIHDLARDVVVALQVRCGPSDRCCPPAWAGLLASLVAAWRWWQPLWRTTVLHQPSKQCIHMQPPLHLYLQPATLGGLYARSPSKRFDCM